MLTSDGVELSFRDSGGDGVPLVMLHGLGQSQQAFTHQFEMLGENRRVITVDFRGHGESGKPAHGYRIARLAADIAELLNHLELKSVDALGWSMGAAVWWSFIDLYGTSRIHQLILVDQPTVIITAPWMSAIEHAEAGSLWDLPTLQLIVAAQCAPQAPPIDASSLSWSFTGEMAPETIDLLLAGMRAAPPFQLGKLLFDHSSQDWRDVLPRIDVPTLVIGSEGSHVTTTSQRETARQIPGSQLHIFAEDVASSHFPFLQNPKAFNDVLERFLIGTPPTSQERTD